MEEEEDYETMLIIGVKKSVSISLGNEFKRIDCNQSFKQKQRFSKQYSTLFIG